LPTPLSEVCVYTIIHFEELDDKARQGGSASFCENKRWTTGFGLWEKAQKEGFGFPLLFGDATDCRRLPYWGLATEIKVEGESTHFTVDRLRKLPEGHAPQELALRKTGEYIAPHFRRPYAICRTPDFLDPADA
jgi:hypothetical protein